MKKHLTAVAALLTLLCLVLSAVACADKGGDTTTAPVAGSSSPSSEEVTDEPVDPGFVSDLSGLDFGGETVSMLVSGKTHSADEFNSFEDSANVVEHAVFRRNALVEHMLNVKFEIEVGDDSDHAVGNKIKSLIKSGIHQYDISTMPGYVHTAFALEGDFWNLLGVENLDLSKLYWTQGFNEIMSNGKQQYVASGAYSLSLIRNMYITLYNKELFEDLHLPDLYEIAEKGEWTIEKQIEIIKGTYNDKNGNSERDDGDFYGFVSGTYTSVDPYWVCLDIPILHLDKTTGNYTIDIDYERAVDAFQHIIDLIMYNEDSWNNGGTSDVDASRSTISITKFAEEKAAMITTTIYLIETSLTQSEFTGDYGIVPMPKFNKDQQEYRTYSQDQLSVMSIVSSADRDKLEMLGAVMDQISYYSYQEVFPAYYENALSYRYLQNLESKIMLDQIYRNLKIEGCFIYHDSFQILGTLRKIVSGQSQLASVSELKSQARGWPNKVRDLNRKLADLIK
jgi:hypothetical protein